MSGEARGWLEGGARPNPVEWVGGKKSPVRAPDEPLPDDGRSEDVDASRAYGGVWGRGERSAQSMEFRFLDPERADETLDYAWLPRIQWCKGQGLIVLHYEALGIKVSIRGVNLRELKERICRHLVSWVQEQGDDPLFIREVKEQPRAEGREAVIIHEIRLEEIPAGGQDDAE
jgi:hypothetical protein